jgi:hypothetical protein
MRVPGRECKHVCIRTREELTAAFCGYLAQLEAMMKKEQALLHLAAQHATTRHSVAVEKAGRELDSCRKKF